MFFEASEFEFTISLEANEQLQPQRFIDCPEKYLYNQGWEVFGLYAFGNRIEDNCRLCRQTTKLIETIPGMMTAGFSSLAPRTYTGPLGLIVPDECAIRVDIQTRSWQEGKYLVFDNTYEHEAWNRSDETRTLFNRPESIPTDAEKTYHPIDKKYWLKLNTTLISKTINYIYGSLYIPSISCSKATLVSRNHCPW